MAVMSRNQMKERITVLFRQRLADGLASSRCCAGPSFQAAYDARGDQFVVKCINCGAQRFAMTTVQLMAATPESARTNEERRRARNKLPSGEPMPILSPEQRGTKTYDGEDYRTMTMRTAFFGATGPLGSATVSSGPIRRPAEFEYEREPLAPEPKRKVKPKAEPARKTKGTAEMNPVNLDRFSNLEEDEPETSDVDVGDRFSNLEDD